MRTGRGGNAQKGGRGGGGGIGGMLRNLHTSSFHLTLYFRFLSSLSSFFLSSSCKHTKGLSQRLQSTEERENEEDKKARPTFFRASASNFLSSTKSAGTSVPQEASCFSSLAMGLSVLK